MKIKNIISICKKSKSIILYDKKISYGETISQYIGDGCAIYPIFGLPYLNEESIFTIFDIPEKQRDKWYFKNEPLPISFNMDDADLNESIIEQKNMSIFYSGKDLIPLLTQSGIIFIDNSYLSPLTEVMDMVELYERETADGRTYIAVKAGLILQAVILPCDIVNEKFVDYMRQLTAQCSVVLAGKMRINTETGEVEQEGV